MNSNEINEFIKENTEKIYDEIVKIGSSHVINDDASSQDADATSIDH